MRSLKPIRVSIMSSILALVFGAVVALFQSVDVGLSPLSFTAHAYRPLASQTTCISRLAHDGDGIYTLRIVGTVGVEYFVEATTSLMPPEVWEAVPGSTHLVTESHGQWEVVVTAEEAAFWFFRSSMVTPEA